MTVTQPTISDLSQEDREGIHQAALDYIEGWYTGDPQRMERALHPELVKRRVYPDPRGFDRLEPISAMGMLLATRHGGGSQTPPERIHNEITVLDVSRSIACVIVRSADYIDYLHLGKFSGCWQIVNVLWEPK